MILENGDGGPTAVFQRTVVILSGLTTDLSFKPALADFLSGEDRAALSSVSSLVFGPTANNTANIEVDADDFVNGNILINAPGGTSAVYFTVANPDGLILTPGDNVVLENGAVDGSTPSAALSVFKVDTTAYSVNGGGTTVYITAAQAAMEGIPIEVAVIVKPNLTAEVLFGSTAASAEVVPTPDWDEEDAVGNLAVSGAVEKNTVFFTASKAAAQTLVPTGDDAGKVTVHTEGAVDGETATETWAVIEVDTRGLVFDGGERTFALEVRETDALPRTVNVTLDVGTRKTGAAAFKVTRPEGHIYNSSWDYAALERLDTGDGSFLGFQAALEWVEINAQADTEYLIRVEQDNLSLPRFAITFNNEANVTLRLRGTEDGPWILKKADSTAVSYYDNSVSYDNHSAKTITGGYKGFFTIGPHSGYGGAPPPARRTFIVGNNITISGLGDKEYAPAQNANNALEAAENATVVMEKGSLITNWYNTRSGATYRPIYARKPNEEGYPERFGKIRIEGGGITNSNVNLTFGLICLENGTGGFGRPAGSFYKAAATGDNPLVFTGNNSNHVCFDYGSELFLYDLVEGELSFPAED
jgi:hypothetical protein